jgi:hypothetical protein
MRPWRPRTRACRSRGKRRPATRSQRPDSVGASKSDGLLYLFVWDQPRRPSLSPDARSEGGRQRVKADGSLTLRYRDA